jgi:RNA polymerase sigma-70 factor (ECF subfamily)
MQAYNFFPLLSQMPAYTTTIPDQSRLLDGLWKLDPQVIGAVYDQFFPDVYHFVAYRLGDVTLAEDIASDVFVRLLEAVRKRRGPQSNLKAWLLTTASHAVNDHLRRSYRRPIEPLSESLTDLEGLPSEEYDRRERNQTVRRALSQLTADQQNVLALRFSQGYSLEETASLMKKNVNAIKALQFRALAALQRKLREVAHE